MVIIANILLVMNYAPRKQKMMTINLEIDFCRTLMMLLDHFRDHLLMFSSEMGALSN